MFTIAQARKAVYPYPVYVALFADGFVQRMSFYQTRGKPWDFERGRRLCTSARKLARETPEPIVSGYIAWNNEETQDPLGAVVAMPKRRQAKAALRKLLAYLDGEHNDESVIDLAREAIAA